MSSKWNTIGNPFNRKFSITTLSSPFFNDRLINHHFSSEGGNLTFLRGGNFRLYDSFSSRSASLELSDYVSSSLKIAMKLLLILSPWQARVSQPEKRNCLCAASKGVVSGSNQMFPGPRVRATGLH